MSPFLNSGILKNECEFRVQEYEKIQILTKGKCYANATFTNCAKKILINDRGKLLLSNL